MHKCCFMLKNYGSSRWPRSKLQKQVTRLPKIVMQVARCGSGSWGRSRGRSVENFVRTAGQNGTQTWHHIERIWTGITFSKRGSMLKPWSDVSICIASLCQRNLSQAKFSIWNATMRWSGPCGRCGLWSWIFFAAFCFFSRVTLWLFDQWYLIWYIDMWYDVMWQHVINLAPAKKWLVKQTSMLNLHRPNCNTHTCFECPQTSDLNIMFDSIQVAVGHILIFFSAVGYKIVYTFSAGLERL